MSASRSAKAGEVEVGARIRGRGIEMTVSRIETRFFGDPSLLAFVEDTETRWIKVPLAVDADVDVLD